MLTSEYTQPLDGQPYYRSAGVIKVYDENDNRYSVGEIVLERFDDQNFQYIIRPYWTSIEALPAGLFHGIQGIDMDLKKSEYYRVNMTPVFISRRTPSKSREDARQLMEEVGLDYYDRFEWLLRSQTKCGDDNLIVVRKEENGRIVGLDEIETMCLTPDDTLCIQSLRDLSSSSAKLVRYVYQILQSGVQIQIEEEGRYLQENERRIMLYLLKNMLASMKETTEKNRKKGRQYAKEVGKYTGRKPLVMDEEFLKRVVYDFQRGQISEQEALDKLSVSRSTFYRRMRAIIKESEEHN